MRFSQLFSAASRICVLLATACLLAWLPARVPAHVRAAPIAGSLAAWGDNANGQLGTSVCCTALVVPWPVANGGNTVAVAGTDVRSASVLSNGSVWEWGFNGTTRAPRSVTGLTGMTDIAAGGAGGGTFFLTLRSDGTVWGWGSDAHGQLGIAGPTLAQPCSSGSTCPSAVQIGGVDHAVQLAAASSAGLALRSNGTVWTWGGAGTPNTAARTPRRMAGLSGIKAMAAVGVLAEFVSGKGQVWLSYLGGNASSEPDGWSSPVALPDVSDAQAAASDIGQLAVIRSSGSLWTWSLAVKPITPAPPAGQPAIAVQIGPGQRVFGVSGLTAISGAAASSATATGGHFLALAADGGVWGWGANDRGQLGLGSRKGTAVPVPVPGINDALQVRTAGRSSFAIVGTPPRVIPPPGPAFCLPALRPGTVPSGSGASTVAPVAVTVDRMSSHLFVLNRPRPVPLSQPVQCGASVTTLDLRSGHVVSTTLLGPSTSVTRQLAEHIMAVAEHAGHLFVGSTRPTANPRGTLYPGAAYMLNARSGRVLRVVSTAQGGLSPDAGAPVALSARTGHVFVVHGAQLVMVRASDARILRTQPLTLPADSPPVVDDGRGNLYVESESASKQSSLTILSTATGTIKASFLIGACAGQLAADARSGKVYVAGAAGKDRHGVFCVIDPRSRRVVLDVDLGSTSASIRAVDGTAGALLLQMQPSGKRSVSYSIRSARTGRIVKALPGERAVMSAITDPKTGRIFLSESRRGLRVLSPGTWRVAKTLTLPATSLLVLHPSARRIVGVYRNDVMRSVCMVAACS